MKLLLLDNSGRLKLEDLAGKHPNLTELNKYYESETELDALRVNPLPSVEEAGAAPTL